MMSCFSGRSQEFNDANSTRLDDTDAGRFRVFSALLDFQSPGSQARSVACAWLISSQLSATNLPTYQHAMRQTRRRAFQGMLELGRARRPRPYPGQPNDPASIFARLHYMFPGMDSNSGCFAPQVFSMAARAHEGMTPETALLPAQRTVPLRLKSASGQCNHPVALLCPRLLPS